MGLSDYQKELDKRMKEVDEQILTCPWCKLQDYTIKKKQPWYRRAKCNVCGKHFVRYDYNDKKCTMKAMTPEMTKGDLPVRTPYGWNLYEFYAVAKGSGNLHYAYTMDMYFDEDDVLIGFNTDCGRDVTTEHDPNWPKKWALYLRTADRSDMEYKSVCLKCRKVR